MTKKDQQDFEKADKCHICNKKYSEKDIRVRGPCHITRNYKGSAHQDCNMNFKLTDKIPVFLFFFIFFLFIFALQTYIKSLQY